MRSVCGCMPTISAATLIMYRGLSSITRSLHYCLCSSEQRVGLCTGAQGSIAGGSQRSRERLLTRVLVRDLPQVLERLLLGLGQLRRDAHLHPCDQVAAGRAFQLRRAASLDLEQLAVLRAAGHL